MEQGVIPQVNTAEPSVNPDAAALALTGNTQADLAAVAKELGVTVDASGRVVEAQPAQPAAEATPQPNPTPAPAQTPAEPVPAKFQNADGSVNVEKLQKSEANLDEAIARYRAKEKEFQTVQNRVNNPPPAPQYQPPQPQLTPFEIQVAQDILNDARALGVNMDQATAVLQARSQIRLQEARLGAEVSATAELRQKVEDNERSRELQGLIEKDQWLLSDEAMNVLWKVRQDNPWLNKAPEPWKAAYLLHKGSTGHTQQVQTPTPQGTTAKAPPAPVGPVARVQKTVNLGDTNALKKMDLNDLEAEAKRLYPGLRLKY